MPQNFFLLSASKTFRVTFTGILAINTVQVCKAFTVTTFSRGFGIIGRFGSQIDHIISTLIDIGVYP